MGMYKVKHADSSIFRVLVMRNVFYTKLPISEKYDLKGSTVNRETKDGSKKGISVRNRNSVVFRDDFEGCASSLQEKQLSAHMDGDNVKPNQNTYTSLKGK